MTKVLVVNENHLQKTPDGKYWSSGIVDYSVFKRPLDVFDQILVAIRATDVIEKDANYVHLCNGDGVEILPLPDYSGVLGYLKKYFQFNKLVKDYCKRADCAIVRTPNAISFQLLRVINKNIPYVLEVAGDPWIHMAPGEYPSKFRPLIRRMWTDGLKKYCLKANGVAYVTKEALQKAYPCRAIRNGESKQYFTSSYSTVSINGNNKYEPKKYEKKDRYKLIHVANAFTTYSKGHKECIEVLARLKKCGLDVSIDFIGEGPLKGEFQDYAKKCGVDDSIKFIGRFNNKEDVWQALREADLFLFPTHSEGLPRVVIESMFVGTPCVSTNVGGIPELLDADCITDVGDVESMYSIVSRMLNNPNEMSEKSRIGIERASDYTEDVLQARRTAFYRKLRNYVDTNAI